jgi:hypothetical protein
MTGQLDGIGKAVFDQPAFRGPEQLGQWVTQGDDGDTRKKFGKGHVDLYGRLPFAKIGFGVLGQIGCSSISGLLCRNRPAGPDGIR